MSVFLVILLVISKLYYVSIFSLAGYNFTLSDICLVLFIVQLILPIGKKYPRDRSVDIILRKIIIISTAIALLNCVSSVMIGAAVTSSVMNIIKRWISMLVIPLYIYRCVAPNKREKITFWIIASICIYTLLNIRTILSADAVRYTAEGTANPNVIAGLFGLLFIFAINAEYKFYIKAGIMMVSAVMMVACSSRGGILALFLTLFYYLCVSNIKINKKIGVMVGCAVIIVGGLILGTIFLPAATERLVVSFTEGFSEVESYQSRMGTLGEIVKMMFSNPELLFFGTGYGNGNLQRIAARYGYILTTADNMYGNLFAWCGLLGLPFIVMYFVKLIKLGKVSHKTKTNAITLITVFMLTLGFTQDAIFEPTVGCLYHILLGLEIIKCVDAKSPEAL